MKFKAFTTCGYCIIIPVCDLLYFQRKQGVTCIYLVNGEMYRINKSLKLVEEQLCSRYFFRCHSSYLVALNQITQVDKANGYVLIMKNQMRIPVATRQRSLLVARLKQLYPGP